MKEHILGIFEEEQVQVLQASVSPEAFLQIIAELVDHSMKAQAELSYDLNTATNAILKRFPGRPTLTVSEVHQTLRDLGIVDYATEDFAYIEAVLKRFGVLVQPDPS